MSITAFSQPKQIAVDSITYYLIEGYRIVNANKKFEELHYLQIEISDLQRINRLLNDSKLELRQIIVSLEIKEEVYKKHLDITLKDLEYSNSIIAIKDKEIKRQKLKTKIVGIGGIGIIALILLL